MIRFSRFFLLGLPVALFVGFFGGSSVSAASPYDGSYRHTDDFVYRGLNCSEPQPGNQYPAHIVDITSYSTYGTTQAYADSMRDLATDFLQRSALPGGAYAASVSSAYGGVVHLWFSPDGGKIRFVNLGSGMYPNYSAVIEPYGDLVRVTLGFTSSGTGEPCDKPIFTIGGGVYSAPFNSDPFSYNNPTFSISNKFDISNVFAYGFDIEYPADYEGSPINEVEPLPRPEYEDAPDIFVVNGLNHKVTIRDRRWATFDDLERNTCKDGLSPMVNYSIFNRDDILVKSGSFSPTVELVVDMPKLETAMDYRIVSTYSCLDAPGEPIFTGVSEVGFHITVDGIYVNDFMSLCMPDGLASIDIEKCMDAISGVINMLGFSITPFNKSKWSYDSDCRNLVVLGSWIHKPGIQVCSFFPAYVRNIVTPFVTFLLGLLMIKFLSKRGGSGF